ncbi:23S rRNA (uracil(1939)-C(5))-methyltransferase RlmD [Candidatus Gracilibacteria bacterium]|nr:23S rRNA (uracil(1939)-C(5))-methyltransferase RlmD [Candidatus Gracilibacteria bacterium]
MKKNDIIENIQIEKLVFGGKGFVRLENGKICFITGGAIPGSRVNLRIIKKKKDFLEAQITQVLEKSSIETGNHEMIPGAPWVNIDYNEQLDIKQKQIEEALFHLKKYQNEILLLPIVGMENTFGYRNKIEFSFGKYISHREEIFQDFNIGFHKRGDFSRVLDFSECFLIDNEQNAIYQRVREYTKQSGLPVYDQKIGTGFWRHFMVRRMYFSGETLLVFSINPIFFENEKIKHDALKELKEFINHLITQFPTIRSVYISHNTHKADILIGDMELIYGTETIEEILLGYRFNIGPKSFFQTNSVGAEALYTLVKKFSIRDSGKKKLGTVLDLYAGTGTIGMIFSSIADKVISVELVEEASGNGKDNAEKNGIHNMEFINAKVEDFLEDYLERGQKADLLIIDPPRAGMHPKALPNILKFGTKQIIYVSCNPATLGRDLEYILANSEYHIEKVQAVDMFPHTHHIETIVSLVKK